MNFMRDKHALSAKNCGAAAKPATEPDYVRPPEIDAAATLRCHTAAPVAACRAVLEEFPRPERRPRG